MSKGKIVVFEGADGSGKTTQINLLSQALQQKGVDFEIVSFPQYGKNQYAEYIYAYLSGKFGNINEVDPHDLAKAYANDRKTVRDQIKNWLNEGKLVIANRYVSSSKAHLGANMSEEKRNQFIKWLDELEYEQSSSTNKENGMPKEDLTILLNIDPRVVQINSQSKNHPDLHEDSLTHQTSAREIFLQLANSEPNWYVVECMKDGEMKSPEEIHKEIMEILERFLG